MQNLILKIKNGDFDGAISCLLQNNMDMSNTNVLNIIITSCTVCTEKQIQADDEAVCNLLRMCVSYIKEPKDTHIDQYLRSVYFILKYLLDKENYLMVTGLQEILLPTFFPSTFNDKHAQYMLAILNTIYNEIIRKKIADTYRFKMGIICLRLCHKVMSVTDYLDRTFQFLKIFYSYNADIKSIEEFYMISLKILKSTKFCPSKQLQLKPIFNIIRLLSNLCIPKKYLKELKGFVQASLDIWHELLLTKEHKYFVGILKVLNILLDTIENYPSNTEFKQNLNECHKNLKLVCQLHDAVKREGLVEDIIASCDTFDSILRNLCHYYYQDVDSELWKNTMSPDAQSLIYKILNTASAFAEKCQRKCSRCMDCTTNTHVFQSICYSSVAIYLFKSSVSKNVYSKNMISVILTQAQRSCINTNLLQKNKCLTWKDAWTDLGGVLYNTGIALYKLNDVECVRYIHLFIESLIKLEDLNSSIISKNVFDSSLLCLKEIYFKSQQYQKAMAVSAVQVIAQHGNKIPAYLGWLKVKREASEHNTTEKAITVIDAFQRESEYVKQIYPIIKLKNETKIDLLISELQMYNRHWPSKIAMASTFKRLFELADCLTSARVGVQIFGNLKTVVHENVSLVMEKICEKLERLETSHGVPEEMWHIKDFILASIYFCCYKYKRQNLIAKNIEDIKSSAVIPLQRPTLPSEIPPDPNDECDIVTAYEKLNFSTHLEVMKFLDNSLHAFENCVLKASKEELNNATKTVDILGVLQQVAHEYRLHFQKIDCLRAWLLVLAFANTTENALAILNSATFIIELIDVNLRSVEKVLYCADGALSKLKETRTQEHLESMTNFYISKSLAYLRNENIQAAVEVFNQAQVVSQDLAKLSQNTVAKARLYYLHSKLLMLPCKYNVVIHNEVPVLKLNQALKVLKELFEDDDGYNYSYIIASLFDVAKAMGETYRWLNLPRELRCYNRELVILAQKQLVPIRAAHFLILLAHADLFSARIDDCQVKIDGLSSILCFEKQNRAHWKKKKTIDCAKDTDHCDVGNLISPFKEICLDVPIQTKYANVGSPTLPVEPFKMPSFVNHSAGCGCFFCSCTEYQELLIMKVHLDALINLHRDNGVSSSLHYFSGILNMHSRFLNKYFSSTGNVLQLYVDNCYIQDISCTYDDDETLCSVLLDYSKTLLLAGRRDEAVKVTNELCEVMSKRKLQNAYLYNEIVLHKLNLISFSEHNASADNNIAESAETDVKNIGECKTPESKVTRVTLRQTYSPEYLSSCNKSFKPIPFELHANNNQDDSNKQNVFLIPKIEVEEPTSGIVKVAKKSKKNISSTVNSTKNLKPADCFVLPVSPDVCTPSVTKLSPTEQLLRTKTKLLTEKIKKCTYTEVGDAEFGEKENCFEHKKKIVLQPSTRKNLLNEFSECESENNKKSSKKVCNQKATSSKTTAKSVRTRSGRTVKNRVL